jgi:hypothetical protein
MGRREHLEGTRNVSNVIDLEAFRLARTRGDEKSAEALFVGAHQREGNGAEELFQRIFGPTSMTFEEWCRGTDSLM